MAGQKLTATKIERYKPTKTDESLADGNGLSLRLRTGQSGRVSRTWIYSYKTGTKSIYLTLGDYQAGLPAAEAAIYGLSPDAKLTLETVRKIAAELTDLRRRKHDPKAYLQAELDCLEAAARAATEAEAARAQQAAIENLRVQDLFNVWLQDGVRRNDGNAELRRSFNADVLPVIGKKLIRELTEHDIRVVLRAMVARGVNRAAVIMRNNLTQMFTWAEKRQPWRRLLADGNPMDLIEIEKIVCPDYDLRNQRDRILSAQEIHELYHILLRAETEYAAAPDKRVATQPLEKTVQHALWIMLATLCRVGELSKARWEHVDFETGEWFIPRQNVKGKLQDFTVYLSPFALAQFRQLHAVTGRFTWCFPARNQEGHVSEKSISKQIGDRQVMFKKDRNGNPRQPMQHRRHDNTLVLAGGRNGAWTPHDLRRTGATMMQGLGVPLDQIDRCQNHVLVGSRVRRHYLHHDYAAEKRDAWRQLGDRLSLILSGPENVVPLQRQAS